MNERWPRTGLYAITPDETDTAHLLERTRAVLAAGAAWLQYRNKKADAALRREQAASLLEACRAYDVPLIVNDDWRLAADIGAAGAHLGEDDGDLRAAINDLQMLSEGKKELRDSDIELFGREKESELFDVLKLVFNAKNSGQIFDKFDYLDLELKDFLLWLEDGVTKEYSYLQEFAYAYNNLADADIFLHRIMRRQHWRFFVYAKLLALAGVNKARISANKKFVSYGTYGKPDLLLKIWSAAAKRKKMQGIAEQTVGKLHTSARRIQQAFWKYFEYISEKNPRYAEGISGELGLDIK